MSDPNLMNNRAGEVWAESGFGDDEGTAGTVLKYPLTLGEVHTDTQNFILFHAKPGGPRNRGRAAELGASDIALHIPPGSMKTKFTGNFTPLTGGAIYESHGATMGAGMTGAAVASTLARRFKGVAAVVGVLAGIGMKVASGGLKKGESIQSAIAAGVEKMPDEAKDFASSVGALAVANFGGSLQPVSATAGVGINPHIAMIYQGPGAFRTHDMTFDFWPRNYKEAVMVKNIVQTFKRRMLPKMHDFLTMKSVYFDFPHEFFIDFYIGTETGPKRFDQMGIRRSVLSSMDINFDASASGPAFYDNPVSDPLPVHTKLSLVFRETEFILENAELPVNSTSDKASAVEPAPSRDQPVRDQQAPAGQSWIAEFKRAHAAGQVDFFWNGGDGKKRGLYNSRHADGTD